MKYYKKYIDDELKKINDLNYNLRNKNISELGDFIYVFSKLLIHNACELTKSVIDLREVDSGSGISWIDSCLKTRYLFELCANHAVLKHGEFNDEMKLRWDKYLYMRKVQIFSNNTFGISIDLLPEQTKKKLIKNYSKNNRKNEETKEKITGLVKLENEHFQFFDPWGMTMYEKLKFIDSSSPNVFLSRWRLYSQISHASSLSLWPLGLNPVPHFDAIQCLALIFSKEFIFHKVEFDRKKFQEKIFELID